MPIRVLLLCAILAISSTSLVLAAAGEAEASAPLSELRGGVAHGDVASGDSDAVTSRHTYSLTTQDLADNVARRGLLDVSLNPETTTTLSLVEYDIFAPGEKKIQYLDATGAVVREGPILARTFAGSVVETGEPAEMTIAPEGLYGVVRYKGVEYSFQPISWSDHVVLQEVVHDLVPNLGSPLTDLLAAVEWTSSESDLAMVATMNLYIKPVAEPSFRSWASDWANRIVNGYFYTATMWDTETSIQLVLYSAAAPSNDFTSSTTKDCGSGLKDLGLDEFESWIWANGSSGVNSYGLWHGADGVADQFGCAYGNCDGTPSGCLQSFTASMPRVRAAHVVQAKDLFSTDNYDASRTDHLDKAAAHELSHNAGEPDHPGDGNCWFSNTYNIMASGVSMGCRGTWRTSNSIGRVNSYAPTYLTG